MKWIEVILKVIRFILNLLKKNKKPDDDKKKEEPESRLTQ